MRILIACGGTAGHINPALAVAQLLRAEQPDTEILFAGNPGGMEARLIPAAGFRFVPIEVMGFSRRLSPSGISHNVKAVTKLAFASDRAKKIIREFKPDIALGTGGYVSGPILYTAAKRGIPALAHEQNAFPGVTTKMLARRVNTVCLAVEATKKHLPEDTHCIVTGNPIRKEVLFANRSEARKKLGVEDRICILSFGGSLGARTVNESVAHLIANFHSRGQLHHIHATGKQDYAMFQELISRLLPYWNKDPHLDIREFIDDMPDCLAAADLVICRSGAITLSELQAAGRASILIPSPNVTENHQYHNAMVLAAKNAAVVLEEKNLTPQLLSKTVEELVSDAQELQNIGRNAASLAVLDAAQRICREIRLLTGNTQNQVKT